MSAALIMAAVSTAAWTRRAATSVCVHQDRSSTGTRKTASVGTNSTSARVNKVHVWDAGLNIRVILLCVPQRRWSVFQTENQRPEPSWPAPRVEGQRFALCPAPPMLSFSQVKTLTYFIFSTLEETDLKFISWRLLSKPHTAEVKHAGFVKVQNGLWQQL